MVRPNSSGSESFHRRAKGSGAASAIAGCAAVAIVVAAGWLVLHRQNATGQNAAVKPPAANPAVSTSSPAKPDAHRDAPALPAPQANADAKATAAARNDGDAVETTAAKEGPVDARTEIETRLAAGEIAPALAAALSAFDPAERTELLKLVAAAQVKAGDFDGAEATIRRIPDPLERVRVQGDRASQELLAGGGSFADFEPLIDLIQQETSGPWEEIDGTGGTISEFQTGVRVDPNGVLAMATEEEREGRLAALGLRARAADLNADMARPSELRLVSLTRLEQEVARRLDAGEPVLETMQHFAGLSQIRYVFVYPDGEVVVGGPAEAWRYDENGLAVGAESGRPTLQLDDFVTVLRTFHDGGLGLFQCLIVPREDGLKSLRAFVDQASARPLSAGAGVKNYASQLQQKLGLQDVQVNGVPGDSRVSRVIVEADYRMKLIGVGKLDAGRSIPSYFDLLTPEEQKSGQMDALRWWLTMKYDAVLHSPDRQVFEIQGAAVKCLSENEFITQEGKRVQTGKTEPTNRLFAQNFTAGYEKLAEHDLIFADLQNVFDLSLVAAILAQERSGNGLTWDLGAFASTGGYEPARYATPKTVMSVVNYRVYNGKDVVVQVAGGVQADLMSVLKDKSVVSPQPRLSSLASQGKAPNLPEGRWWWDAAK